MIKTVHFSKQPGDNFSVSPLVFNADYGLCEGITTVASQREATVSSFLGANDPKGGEAARRNSIRSVRILRHGRVRALWTLQLEINVSPGRIGEPSQRPGKYNHTVYYLVMILMFFDHQSDCPSKVNITLYFPGKVKH